MGWRWLTSTTWWDTPSLRPTMYIHTILATNLYALSLSCWVLGITSPHQMVLVINNKTALLPTQVQLRLIRRAVLTLTTIKTAKMASMELVTFVANRESTSTERSKLVHLFWQRKETFIKAQTLSSQYLYSTVSLVKIRMACFKTISRGQVQGVAGLEMIECLYRPKIVLLWRQWLTAILKYVPSQFMLSI